MTWRVVNARAVLPQQRVRLYFVGVRQDLVGDAPTAAQTPPSAAADAPRTSQGSAPETTTPASTLPSAKRAKTCRSTLFAWPVFPILDISLADILEVLPSTAEHESRCSNENLYTGDGTPESTMQCGKTANVGRGSGATTTGTTCSSSGHGGMTGIDTSSTRHPRSVHDTPPHGQYPTQSYEDYMLTPHQCAKVAATDDWRRDPDLRLVQPQGMQRAIDCHCENADNA